MSFDLGDPVPLSISITDADGNLANAGSVSLTITLPDGTTVTQVAISPTSTGIYDHDYATVQAGRHHVRWVATGANASAYTDSFDVEPADGGDFISLTDAKQHLKKTTTVDDEQLREFVSAACQMITNRMGQVSPATVVEDTGWRAGYAGLIVLDRRPVISVTSVESLPGLVAVAVANEATGVDGWYLASSEGVLAHTRAFSGRVRVTYRAGRTPLPPNFRAAALELVAHLWRTSQLNTQGGRPALGVDQVVVPGVTYALPFNVRQLLGLDKRPHDQILVG